MIFEPPAYVPVVFIATTAAAYVFLISLTLGSRVSRTTRNAAIAFAAGWLILQASLAASGFYENTSSFPPRLVLCGILPALFAVISVLFWCRKQEIALRRLTLIHVLRIPVEFVLLWLFSAGSVPKVMTMEGWNFDILSGVLALVLALVSFSSLPGRWWLVLFNIIGLLLLANIVSIAALSLPTPLQRFGLEQPNIAVLHFPYVWLPTFIVPLVLFAHLKALWQLFSEK